MPIQILLHGGPVFGELTYEEIGILPYPFSGSLRTMNGSAKNNSLDAGKVLTHTFELQTPVNSP